jgi:outer membrane protein TolC
MKWTKTFDLMLVVSVLALALQWSPTANAAEPSDLDHLVQLALVQNPELDAIEAQVTALEHTTTQVGAWRNPRLVVAYQNVPVDSFALGQEPMSMLALRLEQTVPFFGKTADREGVVNKATQAKRHELEEKSNQLKLLVKKVYYRLALARQLRAITVEHVDLTKQLIDAVRIKYEVGSAQQQNLLRLEVLRDRLKDDLEDFDRQDVQLTAALNAAIHRDVATTIVTPDMFELSGPSIQVTAAKERALEHRPLLKQLRSTVQMHRQAADLASFEGVPDPTFFASYGYRPELPGGNPGRDLVTLGVGFPLPVFYGSRNKAQRDEASSLANSVQSQRESVLDEISSGLADALATWTRASSKVKTYRARLVPQAHRVLDATFSSYQVDRADFLSLFEAELELLSFEKTIRIATAEGLVAQAIIEMLVGEEIPR